MRNQLEPHYLPSAGLPLGTIIEHCGFEDFRILAGEQGLINEVKWVHCSDLPDIVYWLRGNELLFHTGKKILEMDLIHLIRQLHRANASGLAIVLPKPELPKEIVTLADELGFPIIFIPDHYRFADVTFSISQLLFASESSLSVFVEEFWVKARDKGLLYADIESQAAFVAEFLQSPVAIYEHTLLVEYSPVNIRERRLSNMNFPESYSSLQQPEFISHPISLYGKSLGTLVIPCPSLDLDMSRYQRLIPHIAFIMALTLDVSSQVDDMRIGLKISLFERILNSTEEEMKDLYAQAKKLQLDLTAEARVVTFSMPANAAAIISIKMIIDILSNVPAFIPMFAMIGTSLKMVFPKTVKKLQLEKAIRQIQHSLDAKDIVQNGVRIGVGSVSRGIKGLQESSNLSDIALDCAKENEIIWYESLSFWQILINNANLKNSISDIERRLESFSAIERTKLLETISSLIQTNFNYSEASRMLGIHRNGLRERLKRYSMVTGCDFTHAEEIVSVWLVLGKH